MNRFFLIQIFLLTNLSSEVLSLHDAQKAMFENNSALKAAELEINKMQQALKETRASLFPSVDLFAGVTYLSKKSEVIIDIPPIKRTIETSKNDKIETGIDCGYPIFTGFSRTNAIKGAQAAITQKEAALRSAQNSSSFTLAQMYLQMDFFAQNLVTIRKHLTTLAHYLRQVKTLRDSGLSTTTKVLEVESKLSNSQVDLAGTLQSVDSLRREVSNLVVIRDNLWTPEENICYFDTITLPTTVDTLRAELQSIEALKRQLTANGKIMNSKKLPSIAATGGYRYGRPGLNGNSDDFMGYFIAGVQVKFNLFDGFKTASQLRQVSLSQDILEKNREGSIDAWNNALLTAKNQLVYLEKKMEAAKLSILAAQALVQSSKEQFEAGQLTQIEYLNAMDNDAMAQLRLEHVRFERRLTILNGLYISGTDLEF